MPICLSIHKSYKSTRLWQENETVFRESLLWIKIKNKWHIPLLINILFTLAFLFSMHWSTLMNFLLAEEGRLVLGVIDVVETAPFQDAFTFIRENGWSHMVTYLDTKNGWWSKLNALSRCKRHGLLSCRSSLFLLIFSISRTRTV